MNLRYRSALRRALRLPNWRQRPIGVVEQHIQSWVFNELRPWLDWTAPAALIADELVRLNDQSPDVVLFRINGGRVAALAKPEGIRSEEAAARTPFYLSLLGDVAQRLPATIDTVLPICLRDGVHDGAEIPVFSFQKPREHRSILLPDVDFMVNRYYERQALVDTLAYSEKEISASFVGATTGGGLIDAEKVRTLAVPRIRAFAYFRNNPRVSFQLPVILHCDTAETVAMLEAMGCGSGNIPNSWQDQFAGRFMLSMDGHGATCARVVIALKSHSALMKYRSDSVLYYFHSLQPWLHYIPIDDDADVERVLDLEASGISFAHVAAAGRQFANTLLNRDAVLRYTASLIERYASRIMPSATALSPHWPATLDPAH